MLEPPTTGLIPVNKNKQPIIAWKKYQSKLPSEEEVQQWKDRYNGRIAGWALPCGIVSGIVALDFDGEVGVSTMNKLGLIPNVSTPGKGFHVWIKAPDYPTRTGSIDRRWPGMEVKGDGGYVLVQGDNILSAHAGSEPVTGSYEILRSELSNLEDLDDELAEFIGLQKEAAVEEAIARCIMEALDLAKDGRNDAGFWLAMQLRDLGVKKPEALNFMLHEFLPRVPANSHPYTAKELRASVNSAYSRSARANDKDSQVDIAVALIHNDKHELWHDGKDGYVTTPEGLNYQIFSRQMKSYISGFYFSTQSTAISLRTIDEACLTLDAIAKKDGKQYETKLRIGWLNDLCFVDTGKNIYEITADGYKAVDKSPVKFLRNETMGILPDPIKGDGWPLLRKYVNVEDEDWPLIQAVTIAAFMPKGAYPVIALTGSHGSGKSTTLSAIISAVDPRPNVDSIRDTMPKDRRNMAIVAKHSLVLSFDNESHISKEISDALAMLSTGGQLKIRELYANDALSIFASRRLVFINSIGDIVTESDLLDRSIVIECPILVEKDLDSEMWEKFGRDSPAIVHAVFESVSHCIKHLAETRPPKTFRMTDFCRWGMASDIDGFLDAYTRTTQKAPLIAIHNSIMGAFIVKILRGHVNDRTRERMDNFAIETGHEEFIDAPFFGPFESLHERGQNETEGWFKTLQGSINGLKRVSDSLAKVGIKVVQIEWQGQMFIGVKNESQAI